MRIKLNIILCLGMIATFSAVAATSSLVLAQSPYPSVLAAQQSSTAEKIAKVKILSLAEIKKRQTGFERLVDKINKNTRISTEDKQTLLSEIQNNITELNKLKNKITTGTDLAVLRDDRKSVKLMRISGVYIPRIQGEFASFKVSATLQKFISILDKVQKKVDKSSIADKTKVNSLLNSAESKIESAKSNNDNALAQFRLVTPQNYPIASKTALQKGKSYLDSTRKDLKSASEDLKQITTILKVR